MQMQTRLGAERAKDELNGIVLHDLDLKIGWGKAVVLPPIPVYTQSGKGGLAPMLAAAKAKAASAYAATPGLVAPAPWQAPPPVQDADPHAGAGQAFPRLDSARGPESPFGLQPDAHPVGCFIPHPKIMAKDRTGTPPMTMPR